MPDSVPGGWERVRLGDVAAIGTGGTPSRERDDFWCGDVPWMASGEIHQRRVLSTAECITPLGLKHSNAKVYPSGTVMVAMNGQGRTRGMTAILGIEAACNQSLAAIRGESRAEQRFLFHVLDQSYEQLRNLTGDGRSGLNLELIRRFDFLLPPLEEQRAIAAVLDAVDDTIERTEAVIAATEELRRALLHELLTRGVPGMHSEWRDVPGLGTVPACWDVTTLREVCEDTPTNGLYKPQSDYGTGTYLVRIDDFDLGRMRRIRDFDRVRASDDEVQRYGLRAGDIVINRVNSIELVGKAVLFPEIDEPAMFESNMMRLRTGNRVDAKFVALELISPRARAYFTSRAKKAVQQASVNQQDVVEFPLALPSIDEQSRISGINDALVGRGRLEEDLAADLRAMKAGLAHSLLTGQAQLPQPALEATA